MQSLVSYTCFPAHPNCEPQALTVPKHITTDCLPRVHGGSFQMYWQGFVVERQVDWGQGSFGPSTTSRGREIVEVVLDGLCPLVKQPLSYTTGRPSRQEYTRFVLCWIALYFVCLISRSLSLSLSLPLSLSLSRSLARSLSLSLVCLSLSSACSLDCCISCF